MILRTIEAINARITEQLDTELLQVAGISVPFQDQQNNNVGLKLSDTGKRFDMDGRLKWQSTHLSDGSRIAESETFGSFTDNVYDARFILIGLSKSKAGHDLAMRAIDGVGYAVVDGYETESLNVLQRYFRVRAGQEKNYDPGLYAFAIRYHIEGVTDEDFAEMPDEQELALLPVIVPEPVIVEVPVIVAPPPSEGSNYIQLISPISVSSGRLLAYIGNTIAYYDPLSTSNLYSLVGVSIVAANPGEPLTIQTVGEITIPGWALIPDRYYFAGPNGTILPNQPTTPGIFSQVVGRAKNANTFIFSPQTIYVNGNN